MLNTKIKHIDWERFLCSRRAEDYVMPDDDYKKILNGMGKGQVLIRFIQGQHQEPS